MLTLMKCRIALIHRYIPHATNMLVLLFGVLAVGRIWQQLAPALTAIHVPEFMLNKVLPSHVVFELTALPLFIVSSTDSGLTFSKGRASLSAPQIMNAPLSTLPLRLTGLLTSENKKTEYRYC